MSDADCAQVVLPAKEKLTVPLRLSTVFKHISAPLATHPARSSSPGPLLQFSKRKISGHTTFWEGGSSDICIQAMRRDGPGVSRISRISRISVILGVIAGIP